MSKNCLSEVIQEGLEIVYEEPYYFGSMAADAISDLVKFLDDADSFGDAVETDEVRKILARSVGFEV